MKDKITIEDVKAISPCLSGVWRFTDTFTDGIAPITKENFMKFVRPGITNETFEGNIQWFIIRSLRRTGKDMETEIKALNACVEAVVERRMTANEMALEYFLLTRRAQEDINILENAYKANQHLYFENFWILCVNWFREIGFEVAKERPLDAEGV